MLSRSFNFEHIDRSIAPYQLEKFDEEGLHIGFPTLSLSVNCTKLREMPAIFLVVYERVKHSMLELFFE